MKKRILIVLLCFACVGTYAQTKKKPVKRTTTRSTTKKGAASARTKTQQTAPVSNTVASQPAPDTTNRKPKKPFERPLDGYYKKNNILNAKVTPYPSLRESDVAFQKRVWREIDVRDKMNTYLASPKRRLIDVLLDAITSGELTAYDASQGVKSHIDDVNGDAFSTPLSAGAARAALSGGDSSVVSVPDKDGNIVSSRKVANEFNPDSVVKFRIKEDWIFDRQRSIFEPRIVGIAPLIRPKSAPGVSAEVVGYQPAFWVNFTEARPILSTKEVVSRSSDATGLSFDDVFMKRIFSSYIVKQSNDKDESIKDYQQGIDKLYEAERIKKSLMDWELNLWQY